MSTEKSASSLSVETLNPKIVQIQFAIGGPIVIRAGQLEKELQAPGGEKKPFSRVIRANLGDCHATGQRPVTFMRQVLGICIEPTLLESPLYADDAKDHARIILKSCFGESVGSYSPPNGLAVVRKHIAEFIERRDGFPSNADDIFLTNGASDAVKALIRLITTERAGVLIPIPVYPLYTAVLSECGGIPVGYYLDEDKNWALSIEELERAVKEARETCNPRAIVVINPGNPTGQVLSYENIKEIVKFANREKLLLIADEVYQVNTYAKEFVSFKKVLRELELAGEIFPGLELASLMSASKGFIGECGLRGGCCELANFHPDVKAQIIKTLAVCLGSNTIGQVAMEVVVNPPRPDEISYPKFCKERDEILSSLKEKAVLMVQTFNSVPGIKCNPVEGAMYAFPRIDLPAKAIETAKNRCLKPDEFYCSELLEATGICVVPGSGFGQKPGTYHFRTTILPPVDMIRESMNRFKQFHFEFLAKYQ